jgi:hypothetical protein
MTAHAFCNENALGSMLHEVHNWITSNTVQDRGQAHP